MDYFLTSKIVFKNSGIEHAEMARLKVFRHLGRQAKIVTYRYAHNTHGYLAGVGLTDDDVVNMFDFFAGTTHQESVVPTLQTLGLPANAELSQQADGTWRVMAQGRLIGRIDPNQYHADQWGALALMNHAGRVRRREYLDSRGFISTAIDLNARGHMTAQQFYRPDGSCYLTAAYTDAKRRLLHARSYQLTTAAGEQVVFATWTALQSYFYDQLNLATPGHNVFISDRAGMTTDAMLAMKTDAIRLEHEHSIHYEDYRNPASATSLPRWEDPQFFRQVDGIITPSKRQAEDIRRRYSPACPVMPVPVGVAQKFASVPYSDRKPGQLIAVARPAYQKHLADMLRAVAQVKQADPAVQLTIYGVPAGVEGDDELNRLKQMVADNGWADFITFVGYRQDLNSAYDEAQIALLTSRFEGSALASVEAQSHGLPQVVYQFNYGIDEVIRNGRDGWIVPQGDWQTLAAKISELLANPAQLAEMSQHAYADAKRYGQSAVSRLWKKALNAATRAHQARTN